MIYRTDPRIPRAVFLLAALLLTGACSMKTEFECREADPVVYNLPDADVSKIPYNGIDTLIFVRTSNQLQYTFVADGITRSYERELHDTGLPGCPPEKSDLQRIDYHFKCATYNKPITVSAYYRTYNEPPRLRIEFRDQVVADRPFTVFNDNDVIIQKKVLGSSFYDVEQLAVSNFDTISCAYFNTRFGVIEMKFSDEKWMLFWRK